MDIVSAQQALDAAVAAALAADATNQQAQAQVVTARQALADAQTALASQVAAGTARSVSIIDNAAFAERQAGKQAVIEFVQAGNQGCTQDDAVVAWNAGALAARPADRQWLLHNADGLLEEYGANLKTLGVITDQSWPTIAGWIAATPAAIIMAS